MAYITNADIATYLNITLSANGETLVDSLIPAVEAFAESYCNRKFSVSGAQTETFDGGVDIFFPQATPVGSITSVTVDGTALTAGDSYNYGSYIRLGSPASSGYRNVVVVYTSAATPPADLKQALIQWIAQMFKESEDAGKTAKRVAFGSVSMDFLAQDGMPKFVELVLNRYRLPVL